MNFHERANCSCESGHSHTQEITLTPDSSEYLIAVRHVTPWMRRKVQKVTKVCSPTLYAWFLIKKAEYESRGFSECERTLLHVTAASSINSILLKNLDYRRVTRAKYGVGVSFSHDFNYANKYAKRSIGSNRALIVADVLVGDVSQTISSLTIPPPGVDTTKGNQNVYVKFYDDEFYPKYIVYYNDC